jgi:hypothetical protein
MEDLFIGTLLISVGYALIPLHWLIFPVTGRTQGWKQIDLIIISTIAVSAHLLGTIILPLLTGLNDAISHEQENRIHLISPVLCVGYGLLILFKVLPIIKRRKHWTYLFSLFLFFSPCLEMHRLFTSVNTYGWDNMILFTMIYCTITLLLIIVLVVIANKLLSYINDLILKHVRLTLAFGFIAIGIASYYLH